MLTEMLQSYLAIRRAAGFALRTTEKLLRQFVTFAIRQGDTHIVSATAIAWASLASSEPLRANRLRMVSRFAQFAQAEDPTHELPATHIFRGHLQRRRPYLFSDEEVQRILQHAGQLCPVGTLRPLTYQTLLGLLAVTGIRISEVLALRFADITSDGLVIAQTKFRKRRLVPLHPTAWSALNRYLRVRQRVKTSDDHVFISRRGTQLSYPTVAETFHALLEAAGIGGRTNSPRPRLHDFRHRFAVKALEACPDSREHVARHMLALSTYLGHTRLESTYWYLETTPQLMSDIVTACETFRRGGKS
jgi:integrase